jgi:hypothetical protein
MTPPDGPILTLEPLIDSVVAGLDGSAWRLSGLQKTTSHEFEGRWKGASTRSAYLFFHREDTEDPVSLDVYLDETSRGLTGNLALVVDIEDLGEIGSVESLVGVLSAVHARHAPSQLRTPVSIRFRLDDARGPASDAESEVRFKVLLPRGAIAGGPAEVSGVVRGAVAAFESLLAEPGLRSHMAEE